MQNLKIAGLQVPLIWEDPQAGLKHIQTYFTQDTPVAELYVLPEMFNTGFTMHPEKCASKSDDPVCIWMEQEANSRNAWICGTVIIEEDGNFYNRLLVYGPKGFLGAYDKKHLFRMAGEDQHYVAGNDTLTINIKGWNISFWICYDLRFPVWMRNTGLKYDLAVIPANWPERRTQHWRKLLQARAIENQSYIIGVNRIGEDGNGIRYSGDTLIADPLGDVLKDAQNTQGWQFAELSAELLKEYREKFAAWKDADNFTILST